MSAAPTEDPDRRGGRLLSTGLALIGLALVGYGGSVQLTVTAAAPHGRGDGCDPWHPLFVVAPIVVGVTLLLVAGLRYARR